MKMKIVHWIGTAFAGQNNARLRHPLATASRLSAFQVRMSSKVISATTEVDDATTMKHMYSHVMDPNIAWTAFKSPSLQQTFPIAEASNIDKIFDYSIANNLPEPFGVYTWESSYLMLDTLESLALGESHQREAITASGDDMLLPRGLYGKTVCDLCCGTGLTSLMAHRLGAKVIALDYNEFSLRLARLSFKEYHTTLFLPLAAMLLPDIDFRIFDMANNHHRLPKCDYLLLSDVLYSTEIAPLVVKRVLEAIRLGLAKWIYITDPGREFAIYFTKLLNDEIQRDLELSKHFKHEYPLKFEEFPHPMCKFGQRMKIRGFNN